MFGKPFDRATLPGRVPALEDDRHLLPGLLHPALEFEQFDL